MKCKYPKLIIILGVLALTACYRTMPINTNVAVTTAEQTATDVPFTEAHNYFVNNTVKSVPVKITSQTEFDKYFGMAAVMGEGGRPTTIDFAKHFVIAVDMPDTYIDTELTPVSLKKENANLVFTYNIKKDTKQSYSIHPFTIIVVNKEYEAKVKLLAKTK